MSTYVCVLACTSVKTMTSIAQMGPDRVLDGNEDDGVSRHIPELDSEHEEQDEGIATDEAVLGGLNSETLKGCPSSCSVNM